MNLKTIITATAAFVVGIGGAYAFTLLPKTIYVKGKLSAAGGVLCIPTDRQCDDAGSQACVVQVIVTTGPNVTSTTYKDAACTVRHTNTTPTVVVSTTQIYQLTETSF